MCASLVPYDLSSGIGEIISNVNPIRQNFSSQYQYNIDQIVIRTKKTINLGIIDPTLNSQK